MDFYIEHQLNLMMMLAGICGFIFLFLLCMKIENKEKKKSFMQIAIFAVILLMSDRAAYIYRGDVSTLGFWLVRIYNFLVYASIILLENGLTNYLLSITEGNRGDGKKAKLIIASKHLVVVGLGLLVISQFTGLYYTFDDTNHYVRAKFFIVCYIIPIVISAFQVIFICKNRKLFRRNILISLSIFIAFPIIAGVVQIFCYGASLTSTSMAVSAIIIYFFALFDQNNELLVASKKEMDIALEMQEKSNELLHQTVEALASAVDAKDTYTNGHSNRVARYAEKIARMSGMSEKECDDVYLAGLLHDVGKIGIRNEIINKSGKLTDEEYTSIKQHTILGGDILSKIMISPSLSVGARYHHERYDGKGYPDKLKGEDIPHIARIIAVADAYDAMTSKRSYRDMIPQMYVREELVKGIGTQFDPTYAKYMLQLLDQDSEYKLKEKRSEEVFGADLSYDFGEFKTNVSSGIRITDCTVSVTIQYKSLKKDGIPTLLLYDSADARYYLEESSLAEEMDFFEYASIGMDGYILTDFVRKMKTNTTKDEKNQDEKNQDEKNQDIKKATITLTKQSDHLLVKVDTGDRIEEVIFALFDASRYVYLAITGEYCSLEVLDVKVAEEPVEDGYVPRIADKISYIDDNEGDIPNIQVDAWKSCYSEIIEFTGDMDIKFHTLSLPASRRVWHCPILALFTSDDGTIGGPNYREIVFVRLDGESWSDDTSVGNETTVSMDDSFENWSIWKQKNKAGADCSLSLSHHDDIVDLQVVNSGLTTVNKSLMPEKAEKVYCYFTGDQCAITDIHITKKSVTK